MKDSRKIMLRFLTLYILLATSLMLGGCSTIYDVIMWAPRQLWSVTGDKVFGVHNEQQTDMGPRRRPENNPQGNGGSMSSYPSSPAVAQDNPMQMQQPGNFPDPSMQATMPYPQSPGQSQASPSGAGNYPPLSGAGIPNAMPSGNSAAQQQSGYPPMPQMPPIPPQYQQAPGAGKSSQMQQMPGNFQTPDLEVGIGGGESDGISSDAAYARGGMAGEASKKGWSIPFISGNYKIERRFEPLSEQFVVAKNELQDEEYLAPNPAVSEGDNLKNKPNYELLSKEDKEKATRSANMFPLDQYAPKPTIVAQSNENKDKENNTYPKLGRIPQTPQNLTDANSSTAELDKLVKESEEAQAQKDAIHNLPNNQNGEFIGNTDIKSQEAGAELKTPTEPEKNPLEKIPLVKRRDGPQSPNYKSVKEPVAVAPETLQNDADIMKEIVPDKKIETNIENKQAEPEKGFFARLHDKIFNPSPKPKMVWRKSEPPVTGRQDDSGTTATAEDPVLEQNLPAFNMPEKFPANKSGYNDKPAPDTSINNNLDAPANNNYDSYNGSLLPNSRYTDRRKVPQQD